MLNAGTFRAAAAAGQGHRRRRRPTRWPGRWTTRRTIGGGGTVVAQNDQDLAAEWGLSSFDRRHQLTADLSVELPFGPNKPWLNGGGIVGALLRGWRCTANFTWQSGTPLTPRVAGVGQRRRARHQRHAARRLQRRRHPARRTRRSTSSSTPRAFSCRPPGTFGNAPRNIIIGPGSQQLNAQFSRDVRMSGNRALTLQVNATNLLNMVNYAAIDTVVNSPTFGQVLSVRPMRSVQLELQVPVLRCLMQRLQSHRPVAASRSSRRSRSPRSAIDGAEQPSRSRGAAAASAGLPRAARELVSVDVIVRDKSRRGRARPDRRRLRGHRGRQAAGDPQLQLRGDHATSRRRRSRRPTLLAGVEAQARSEQTPRAGRAAGAPARRRAAGADDLGAARRPPADRAALRHQLDAARGRAARGRLGEQVRRARR